MNAYWGRGLLVFAIIAFGLGSYFLAKQRSGQQGEKVPELNEAPQIITSAPASYTAATNASAGTAMAARFNVRFKPALSRWAEAYKGHLPFDREKVGPESYHSSVSDKLHTYMVGSYTLTFQEQGDSARVFYMASGERLSDMNRIPQNSEPPNVTMPVTREEVLKMAKADAGIDYQQKDMIMRPTGISGSMGGGAAIEIGGHTGDKVFRSMTKTNLDIVFDVDGKIVYYLR